MLHSKEPLAYTCSRAPTAPQDEGTDVTAEWSWWPAGITCTAHEPSGPLVFAEPSPADGIGVYAGTGVLLAVELLGAVAVLALLWPERRPERRPDRQPEVAAG